jgi:hypothetical protein
MIQKDFIMRMIQQLTKMLAKILLLKEQGNQKEALIEVENAVRNTIGIDPELLDSLSIESISELFGISMDPSAGSIKCIVTGRLLKEKAEIFSSINDAKSKEYYHKALGLYLKGILNIGYTEIDLTSYYSDVKEIDQILGKLISTEETYLEGRCGSAKQVRINKRKDN